MSMIVFLLFRSQDHIAPFLDCLNSQHPCIKFTHEVERGKTMAFLHIKTQYSSNGSFVDNFSSAGL